MHTIPADIHMPHGCQLLPHGEAMLSKPHRLDGWTNSHPRNDTLRQAVIGIQHLRFLPAVSWSGAHHPRSLEPDSRNEDTPRPGGSPFPHNPDKSITVIPHLAQAHFHSANLLYPWIEYLAVLYRKQF